MTTRYPAGTGSFPNYLPPSAEVIEIAIERGFGDSGLDAPDYNEENWES